MPLSGSERYLARPEKRLIRSYRPLSRPATFLHKASQASRQVIQTSHTNQASNVLRNLPCRRRRRVVTSDMRAVRRANCIVKRPKPVVTEHLNWPTVLLSSPVKRLARSAKRSSQAEQGLARCLLAIQGV